MNNSYFKSLLSFFGIPISTSLRVHGGYKIQLELAIQTLVCPFKDCLSTASGSLDIPLTNIPIGTNLLSHEN